MTHHLRSAVVLGAGTMGAQIAAHLANAGIPALLLDVTADAAAAGLARARALKPDPFMVPEAAALIRTGSLDDLAPLAAADWIIEAIVEDLAIKQALLARVDAVRAPHAVVSSNTSGIPLAAIAEGRSEGFRRHWIGTHFFNPPRYLRLVELITTADTGPDVAARVQHWLDQLLGKGVVPARDTPAFIANHLGMFGVMRLLDVVADGSATIEEVDAITGPATGRPKSATFRTVDIAGLDILAKVAAGLSVRLPREDDRRAFAPPAFVAGMLERKLIGDKAGQGFYKKTREGGDTKILTLDLASFTYRDKQPARLPELEVARGITDTGARVRDLFLGDHKTGMLLRRTLGPTLLYAARIAADIAHDIDDIDRAMRWGFGWDLGPFELWDAIGVDAVLKAMRVTERPALLQGRDRFRDQGLPPAAPDLLILQTAREQRKVVQHNDGASLIDLGDGVLCVEFHSKMNAIGGDTIAMLHAGVREAEANFTALVVGNDAPHFSAGANLMLLLLEAQEGNWDEVDMMIRAFQGATMALKTAAVPVVVAPGGLALGGGCELSLHGDRVQAAAETYMGLVEVGVGLIPAGGGTKEMLLRAPSAQAAFETIGFGKVSTSGPDARRLGYLRDADRITMNRERLITDAKAMALTLARAGYQPPVRRAAIPVGGPSAFATLSLGVHLAWRAGRLSDHDAVIGRKLAWILTGGNVPHATTLSEDQILELEREAFLSLCAEAKTQERIAYTLKTGKTLRN
ncbi:MAG: 3-hydroxyacyl-CoA dehydrogenase NAD-binding domain-containing protein [Acidobacteria bacterium]|nr:3-hydroxyacyl-CoA dehydrogenase NAD-binding domain-containing protein [Acidobacteriota bacterium]